MVGGLELVSVVDWLLGLDSEGDMVVVIIVVAVDGYGDEGGKIEERREEKIILKERECLSVENCF